LRARSVQANHGSRPTPALARSRADRNLLRYVLNRPTTAPDPSVLFPQWFCNILSAPVPAPLIPDCLSLCSAASDLDELRKILNKLCKDRGDCNRPKNMAACWTKCQGRGNVFELHCKQCC